MTTAPPPLRSSKARVGSEPNPIPKLAIDKFADAAITCLKLTGAVEESFDGKKLASQVQCETLVLDLGGVNKISSFGIREWNDFIALAGQHARSIILIECSPKIVDQLNMVAGFAGAANVFSFYAPFRCDYCNSEHRVLLQTDRDIEAIKAMKLYERPCLSCKESMYFDEDGATYFSYIAAQGYFELQPEITAFLAAKLDYRVAAVGGKLRVDKMIEGRVTYLRLAGDLNSTFPRAKLAEGLEGTVIIDAAAVGRIEPVGAAEWRDLVHQVTPLVDQMYIVGAPPQFVEKLCVRDDLGAKVQVASFELPYTCPSCATTSAQLISVVEHHAVLKFATAPELHCPQCKAAMQCAAGEAVMTVVATLPKPTIDDALAATIAELRARRIERASLPRITMAPRPMTEESRSNLLPFILLSIAAVAAAFGVVAYLKSRAPADPGPFGVGAVAARSAGEARPAWIPATVTPGTSSCTATTCVGVSTISASQADAEDEASEAAVEAIAFELGKKIEDKAWQASVPSSYMPAREAALAELARDPQSTQARRGVRDGRHAVAQALKGLTPNARYWEAYDSREGRRFVAFAQVELPATAAKQLTASFAATEHALGATVVTMFPELAWRSQKLDHGAIIVGLEHGPLQELGLAEKYVVLAVDGREVADAATFAKLATDEYAQLSEHGGALRLLVQPESGDPREFQSQIAGKATQPNNPHPATTGPTQTEPSGPVNVWDRYGGSRRNGSGGRDDPRQ